jgi:hypothetical protein
MRPPRTGILCVALAIIVVFGTAACGFTSSGTGTGGVTLPPRAPVCLEKIAFTILESSITDEGPNFFDYYDIVKTCARPAVDLAAQFTGSHDLEVLSQELPDPDFPYTFTGTPINNCASPYSESGTYEYNLPLVLIVGTADVSGNFQSTTFVEPLPFIPPDPAYYELLPAAGQSFPPTTATTTDAELIAETLYSNQDLPQYFNPVGQPSDSFALTVPAHSEVTLHLPVTIDYRIGEAEVNHSGQPGPGYLWAYAYQFSRDFDPANLTPDQMTVTPCS